jgi:hypothetical protein
VADPGTALDLAVVQDSDDLLCVVLYAGPLVGEVAAPVAGKIDGENIVSTVQQRCRLAPELVGIEQAVDEQQGERTGTPGLVGSIAASSCVSSSA